MAGLEKVRLSAQLGNQTEVLDTPVALVSSPSNHAAKSNVSTGPFHLYNISRTRKKVTF